ncbi:SMP-30/gluconolactonase/LRE family protein [Conexibacter sp. JD483]|uniref:SMP-30/gluconolactonase/LRE family protein n=1 Tax=unclassified Conexibacter TaxID=2627773 RepID=UPI00271C145D|nr:MULTISPECIES: SMP-30/gluconolactonase/LRE family protein [unclassified Conexibacter]MDO8185189.1 SMP-30/gluconolactonase/LRE family protein [Conexibacter sp. CPCC 205706]MDO8198235.1 SMP-30/gluconolactonase/LRE family protein [Conexibacter sp. CPCC 205762]MDR9367803.1 SMP-30/gluconolactonase/LRE family protein [Conexibacter sp. JD483]
MSGAVEVFHAARAALGEGPCWDAARGELLWVDMLAERVHATTATGSTAYAVGALPGAAIPLAGGDDLLLALGAGVARLARGSGEVVPLAALAADPATVRVNDAKVDPGGRLWVGATRRDMAPGGGTLQRLGDDGLLTCVLDGLDVPNGLGWSPDGETLYLADSPRRTIARHRVDPLRGELLGSAGPALDTSARPGQPDGLAVDADGNLWVAFWDGGAVRCYTPGGALLDELRVPLLRPTSCAFGGADDRDLLITSSCHGYDAAQLAAEPAAGSLLVARPGVAGLPPTPARIA